MRLGENLERKFTQKNAPNCPISFLFLSDGGGLVDVAKRSGRVQVGSIGFTGRGSKHVIFKQVNWVAGRVGSGWPVFFKQVFFFFFNYKNKSMTTCLERMNKICTAPRYPDPNWALISGLVWNQNAAPRCPNPNWALDSGLAARPRISYPYFMLPL